MFAESNIIIESDNQILLEEDKRSIGGTERNVWEDVKAFLGKYSKEARYNELKKYYDYQSVIRDSMKDTCNLIFGTRDLSTLTKEQFLGSSVTIGGVEKTASEIFTEKAKVYWTKKTEQKYIKRFLEEGINEMFEGTIGNRKFDKLLDEDGKIDYKSQIDIVPYMFRENVEVFLMVKSSSLDNDEFKNYGLLNTEDVRFVRESQLTWGMFNEWELLDGEVRVIENDDGSRVINDANDVLQQILVKDIDSKTETIPYSINLEDSCLISYEGRALKGYYVINEDGEFEVNSNALVLKSGLVSSDKNKGSKILDELKDDFNRHMFYGESLTKEYAYIEYKHKGEDGSPEYSSDLIEIVDEQAGTFKLKYPTYGELEQRREGGRPPIIYLKSNLGPEIIDHVNGREYHLIDVSAQSQLNKEAFFEVDGVGQALKLPDGRVSVRLLDGDNSHYMFKGFPVHLSFMKYYPNQGRPFISSSTKLNIIGTDMSYLAGDTTTEGAEFLSERMGADIITIKEIEKIVNQENLFFPYAVMKRLTNSYNIRLLTEELIESAKRSLEVKILRNLAYFAYGENYVFSDEEILLLNNKISLEDIYRYFEENNVDLVKLASIDLSKERFEIIKDLYKILKIDINEVYDLNSEADIQLIVEELNSILGPFVLKMFLAGFVDISFEGSIGFISKSSTANQFHERLGAGYISNDLIDVITRYLCDDFIILDNRKYYIRNDFKSYKNELDLFLSSYKLHSSTSEYQVEEITKIANFYTHYYSLMNSDNIAFFLLNLRQKMWVKIDNNPTINEVDKPKIKEKFLIISKEVIYIYDVLQKYYQDIQSKRLPKVINIGREGGKKSSSAEDIALFELFKTFYLSDKDIYEICKNGLPGKFNGELNFGILQVIDNLKPNYQDLLTMYYYKDFKHDFYESLQKYRDSYDISVFKFGVYLRADHNSFTSVKYESSYYNPPGHYFEIDTNQEIDSPINEITLGILFTAFLAGNHIKLFTSEEMVAEFNRLEYISETDFLTNTLDKYIKDTPLPLRRTQGNIIPRLTEYSFINELLTNNRRLGGYRDTDPKRKIDLMKFVDIDGLNQRKVDSNDNWNKKDWEAFYKEYSKPDKGIDITLVHMFIKAVV